MRQKPHGFGPPTARFKPKSPDHGRHIYAYRNVQTNQVLYSLTRTLDGIRSLRQLRDIGANTAQATGRIRRDLWRPLWSVTFPHSEYGIAQGQHAFRQLREWRRLHELYWQPPASLSQPLTEEKKEELRKRLRDRGGSKKETIFDLIKREKKKIKRDIIMDQKANSIADLAAVLDEQEWLGVATKQRLAELKRRERLQKVREMLRLSIEAQDGGVQKVEQEIADLRPYLERQEGFKIEDGAKMGQRAARRQLYNLQRKLERMRVAATVHDTLPQKEEQVKRLEAVEAEIEQDIAKLAAEERTTSRATQLEGELEGVREAKDQFLRGRPLQPLLDAAEDDKAKLEGNSTQAPEAQASKARIEDLRRSLEGYEVALSPATIFSKLNSASINKIDVGAADLPAIIKDINAQLRHRRTVGRVQSWVNRQGKDAEAQVQQLQRDKEFCERLMPAYEQAKQELREEGGEETVREWIEDLRGKMAAAPLEEAEQARNERALGLADGYKKALAVVQDSAGVQSQTAASEDMGSDASNAQQWLESLWKREKEIRDWTQSATGRLVTEAEREVPEMTDTASARSALSALQAKFLRTWILMQEWVERRQAKKLLGTGLANLTTEQRAWLEGSDQRLETFKAQKAAIKDDAVEDTQRELFKSKEAIQQTWRDVEEEISTSSPSRAEHLQLQATKLEIFRSAMAQAEGKEPEQIFPEITLPSALQETADDWLSRKDIDYTSFGPIDYFTLLPAFPPDPTPDPEVFARSHPVMASQKHQKRKLNVPIFDLSGVKVKWHNILDAEFAASWPEDVTHEPMGLVKYVAPEADAEAEPVLDVAAWRRMGIEKRLGKKMERQRVVQGLSEAVVRAVKADKGDAKQRVPGGKLRVESGEAGVEEVEQGR